MVNAIQRTAAKMFGLPTRNELADAQKALQFASKQLRGMRSKTASGVDMTWGRYENEFNDRFSGSEKWLTLDKMEADPRVKAAQRRHSLPLMTAEWEFSPASDKPKDIEIAEFCAANLLRANSDQYGREYWLQTPWKSQRLSEVLRFQRDGYSVFVKSHRVVGGKVVFDRLQWLEPQTISRWILDPDDRLTELLRTYDQQTGGGTQKTRRYEEPLTADKIKLYAWDMIGARYNGRSAWRSMFGAWFRKDFLQRVAIIWAQKVGAPIPIGFYPKNWDDSQRAQFEEFVQSMMGLSPDKGWGVFEKDEDGQAPEVKFAGVEGEPDRSTPLVDLENRELAQGMDTSSSMLGESQSGSRALGQSKGMVDMISVEATAEIIGEQESHGVGNILGVIDELVHLNFANVTELPRLVAPKINIFERRGVVQDLVIPAVGAGLMPNHPDLRRQITDMAGFSLPDEAFEQEPVPPPDGDVPDKHDDAGDENPDENTSGRDEQEQEKGAALSLADREAFRRRIAPLLEPAEGGPPIGGSFRRPNKLEAQAVNLAEISRVMRVGERDALAVLRVTRQKMIADLMGRLRKGKITERSVDTQRRSKFRFQKQAESAMGEVLTETGRSGADHVDAEISAQMSRA